MLAGPRWPYHATCTGSPKGNFPTACVGNSLRDVRDWRAGTREEARKLRAVDF